MNNDNITVVKDDDSSKLRFQFYLAIDRLVSSHTNFDLSAFYYVFKQLGLSKEIMDDVIESIVFDHPEHASLFKKIVKPGVLKFAKENSKRNFEPKHKKSVISKKRFSKINFRKPNKYQEFAMRMEKKFWCLNKKSGIVSFINEYIKEGYTERDLVLGWQVFNKYHPKWESIKEFYVRLNQSKLNTPFYSSIRFEQMFG